MKLTRRHMLTFGTAALAAPVLLQRAHAQEPSALVVWTPQGDERFGGFSAIELEQNRLDFLALSDRGFLTRGRLSRAASGQLQSVQSLSIHRLADRNGPALRGPRADSEGLDLAADGSFVVSFEGRGRTRVQRYQGVDRAGPQLSRHPDWRNLPRNSGLETLAVDARGTVFAIPEQIVHGGFPLYRLRGEDWDIAAILPSRNGYYPVGADFGPDGNLYLLERKFRVAFFSTRLSRISPENWEHPQTLVETAYGSLDNHEGISVSADPSGALWATTISDDNNNRFQRTEIAEFRLD